ncbi:MAG: protein-L-isoaspartate(D-aspartate) O-methyltransferase [Hyphomicrobiales bacterium]
MDDNTIDNRRIQLLMQLRNQGIRSTRVLEAIEKVPRDAFVPQAFADQSYTDQPLPIACGQTISQPYIVAFMSEHLKLTDRMKVLEVGTGSGYQTAILAYLARRVYTLERYGRLLHSAEQAFKTLRINNVVCMVADGLNGWPAQAPFDRIIVTAAVRDVPRSLVDQLDIGGIMIIPLDISPGKQELRRITRTDEGVQFEALLPVRFVPMIKGVAKES